ncbi:MAG: transcriptional regulator, PadR family protein [Xanthobacteraceae bacterium]|jgi:DNA-binding PadR family transcriptional regulator|nr:transcriptional regulator, PadR family protein [Xanthobacteraceae bacterium]
MSDSGRFRGGRGGGGRFFDHGELRQVVLALLGEQPRHGYDIIRAIEQRTGGAYCPSPGVIYPTLQLLEDVGHAIPATADGTRNSYQITPAGRAFLDENNTLIGDIMSRVARAGRRAQASPIIVAAMDNLKSALRSSADPWSEPEARNVAAAIDAAANHIRSLRQDTVKNSAGTASENIDMDSINMEATTMLHSIARIESERASIYLQQLCKHFAHKAPVEFTSEKGQITFSSGICRLEAKDSVLTLMADAEDEARMTKLQEVVEKHLIRFAFREPHKIEWHAANAE